MTLKDLFAVWKSKIQNKFYVILPNNDMLYFIHKIKEQDFKNP